MIMTVIGLTGPSGAGKSTVCSIFKQNGIPVISADSIYRDICIPRSPCLNDIVAAFGNVTLPDGTLDRKTLAKEVFSDSEKLKRLNNITHGYVLDGIRKKLSSLSESGCTLAVVEAPQLFESGFDSECDLIVSVLCERNKRKERLIIRDSLTDEAIEKRISSQLDDNYFRLHSDEIIENNGSLDSLASAVYALIGGIAVKQ